MTLKKAKYYCFEGIDGSGKTKHLNSFVSFLEESGYKVLVTRELGSPYDNFCQAMRSLILENTLDTLTQQYCLAACSIQHSQAVLQTNMYKYDYIISDRGVESNLAYGYATGISKSMIDQLFLGDARRIYPDKVIYLHVPPEVSWKRLKDRYKDSGAMDVIEQKGPKYQALVQSAFQTRAIETTYYYSFDTSGDFTTTALKIRELI